MGKEFSFDPIDWFILGNGEILILLGYLNKTFKIRFHLDKRNLIIFSKKLVKNKFKAFKIDKD